MSQTVIKKSESGRVGAEIRYGIAANQAEREGAFRLVYQSYLREGLTKPNPHQLRVTPYQLESSSDIFLATIRKDVICTMTLVADGKLGLPMEGIFADLIGQRRQAGLALAEVSCLADRRRSMHRCFPVLLELCRWMVQAARLRGIDQLLVAVHPRHVKFYQRFLAFEEIGQERSYASVCGNPALALCLDFEQIDRQRPRNWDRFFARPIPPSLLEPQPMSHRERNYFAGVAHTNCTG